MAQKEIYTFSAAVDDVVVRSGRPDKKIDIMSYVRTTMREAQVQALFWQDHVEDVLNANADPFIWTPPVQFRQLQTAEYPTLADPHNRPVKSHFVSPGKSFESHDSYHYRSGDYYVFTGIGLDGTTTTVPINVGYFSYFDYLNYYQIASRPARYIVDDELGELGWQYLTAVSPEDKEAAEKLVTNWMLTKWYEMCVEGGLAKVFNTVNDDRRTSSFSLFEKYKVDVRRGERVADVNQK